MSKHRAPYGQLYLSVVALDELHHAQTGSSKRTEYCPDGGRDWRGCARLSHRSVHEGVHDVDDAGAEDHHEQRREKAEQGREQDLDRYLLGLLLGPLAAPHPHLLRLLPEYLPDRYPKVRRVYHGRGEAAQLRYRGPARHRPQRLGARLADAHLLEYPGGLAGHWPPAVAGDLGQRPVEALPGLDADGQGVQDVGQRGPQAVLALDADVVDGQVGAEEAEREPAEGGEQQRRAAAQHQAQQRAAAGPGEQTDALGRDHPFDRPGRRVAGAVELALQPGQRSAEGERGADPAEAPRERLADALAEGTPGGADPAFGVADGCQGTADRGPVRVAQQHGEDREDGYQRGGAEREIDERHQTSTFTTLLSQNVPAAIISTALVSMARPIGVVYSGRRYSARKVNMNAASMTGIPASTHADSRPSADRPRTCRRSRARSRMVSTAVSSTSDSVPPTSRCTRIAITSQARSWLSIRAATRSSASSSSPPRRLSASARPNSPATASSPSWASATIACGNEKPDRSALTTSCSDSGSWSAKRRARRVARSRRYPAVPNQPPSPPSSRPGSSGRASTASTTPRTATPIRSSVHSAGRRSIPARSRSTSICPA